MHTSKGKLLEQLQQPLTLLRNTPKGNTSTEELSSGFRHQVLDYFVDAAHFVVDRKIFDLSCSTEADKSFAAMAKAGVLGLPFDPMIVEFKCNDTSSVFVRLSEKLLWPFPKEMTGFIDEKLGKGYTLFSYPIIFDTVAKTIGSLEKPFSFPVEFNNKERNFDRAFKVFTGKIEDKKVEVLGMVAAAAMRIALLMLNTRGVITEKISMARLDKQRRLHSKPAIGDYTIVKIGHLYDRSGKTHEYNKTGRHMPVHWRCGHIRNVHYGAMHLPLSERHTRAVYIPPCLVNYDPATTKKENINLPKHEVTI